MKQVNELLMGVSVEDELAAVGVKRDLEHAIRLAGEAGIGECVTIGFKTGHDAVPPLS